MTILEAKEFPEWTEERKDEYRNKTINWSPRSRFVRHFKANPASSPTVQRASQRLLTALVQPLTMLITRTQPLIKMIEMKVVIRDITQAYVQSSQPLNRVIFCQPPKELRESIPREMVIRVVQPLYGLAESGLFWWATYHRHHREELMMNTSTYDPCLLITDPDRTPDPDCFGITVMQTDDTLNLCTEAFD
jgi:hypothetical protein